MYPAIDVDKCIICKICIEICPYEVFGEEADIVIVAEPENCIECGECIRNCKNEAIKLVE